MKHKYIIRDGKTRRKYVIEYSLKDGQFSMSGEIWRYRATDCDQAGQCIDSIAEELPKNKLVQEMREVWKRWHLNDMRANCVHQVGDAWTPKQVTLYNFTTKMQTYEKIRAAEKRARLAIENGETFTPTSEETRVANLKHSLVLTSPLLPKELADDYEPKKDTTYSRSSETKLTNWLSPSEHPDGYLGKPCPVCGYKYGTAWLREEIPDDVIKQIESWSERVEVV